jgi:hypothetical protein
MAASTTLKGTEYTKTAAILAHTASAESFPDASKRKLRGMYDEFVDADTAWDLASEIGMGYVPKGARVLGFIVSNDAVGAAVTADLEIGGVAATAAEAWTSMNGANQLFIPALATFQDTPLTTDSVVTVVTAAATLAATKKITVTTVYLDED